MEQSIKDKFDLNKEEHTMIRQAVSNTRLETRLLISVLGILMSVIIFLLSTNVKYQKLAYNASIARYDYNHKLDHTIKGLSYRLDSISNNVNSLSSTMIKINYKIYLRDSLFYYNEYKPLTKMVVYHDKLLNNNDKIYNTK